MLPNTLSLSLPLALLLCLILLQLPRSLSEKSFIHRHVGTFHDEAGEENKLPVKVYGEEERKFPVDVTLVGTADGMLHAIDDETSEKLWSVDTGGPMVSTSTSSSSSVDGVNKEHTNRGDHSTKESLSVLPTVDGSLFINNGQGMRKTSVKARLLAEKAPFMSQEGDMFFSSQKTSKVLGVDLDNGRVTDLSAGTVTLSDKNRARVGSGVANSKLKPVLDRKPLWVGRVDYTIKAYDSVTGEERFNFSYSELTPLNAKASDTLAESDENSGGTGFLGSHDRSNSNNGDSGGLVPLHQSHNQHLGVPMPLISTPEGGILFADKKGLSYHSMELGSAVAQAFSVSSIDDQSSVSDKGKGGKDVLANSDYMVRPLRVGYRMAEMDEEENQEGKVAIVRDLHGGGLYAIELSSGNTDYRDVNSARLVEEGGVGGEALLSLPGTKSSESQGDMEDWSTCNDSCTGVYWNESQGTLTDCANSPKCENNMRSAKAASIASLLTLLEDDEIDELFAADGPLNGRKMRSENKKLESTGKGIIGMGIVLLHAADVFILRSIWFIVYALVIIVVVYSLGYQHLLPSLVTNTIAVYILNKNGPNFADTPSIAGRKGGSVHEVIEVENNEVGQNIPTMIDDLPMVRIGSLYVSDSVLGTGSHGTVVLLGNLNGRKVAVKRMLSQFTLAADREISLLIRSDGHPNVVRYFFRELKGEFVYLALQLCEMSLRDFISTVLKHQEPVKSVEVDSKANGYAALKTKRHKATLQALEYGDKSVSDVTRLALFQLADGLAHLHSKRIMHRDIKPHNILLACADAEKETDVGSTSISLNSIGRYLLKISDMGLSKQLDTGSMSNSFASSNYLTGVGGQAGGRGSSKSTQSMENTNNPVGTIGWQAPELMQCRNTCKPAASEGDDDTEDIDKTMAEISNPVRFQRVDIFSLGCVFHYVMFLGEHPFGEWYEREANIMNAKLDLSHLKNVPCAHDLLERMLAFDPRCRPNAAQVSKHPFFWSSLQRLDFLTTLSDRLEHEPLTSPIIQALETNSSLIVGKHWDRKLHPALLEDMGKYRKYDTGSIRDLLRVIRNKRHHFAELSEEIKMLLCPIPDAFLTYFQKRFPKLLLHAVCIASSFLEQEKDFIKDISPISNLFASKTAPHTPLESLDDSMDKSIAATEESTIWRGSQAALDEKVRGWWQGAKSWEMSYANMHFKSKARPGHLLKSSQDLKYRSRLCNHWEETNGDRCPMRKKGKCVFAHGPLELRVKESRRDKWNQNPNIAIDLRCSGGEDVFGAAREVERIRKVEGSISEFEHQSIRSAKRNNQNHS